MDTSETYIKMCEKAEEIQEDWQPQYGDYIGGEWFIDQEDNLGLTPLGLVRSYDEKEKLINTGGDILWNKETNYWLPRQDQLQEMVFESNFEYENLAHLAWSFDKFCNGAHPNPFKDNKPFGGDNMLILRSLTSMEQLWLAFCMSEKYGKVWSGTEWIKGKG